MATGSRRWSAGSAISQPTDVLQVLLLCLGEHCIVCGVLHSTLSYNVQVMSHRYEHAVAYPLAHLMPFGVSADFLRVWLRPLPGAKKGKKRKRNEKAVTMEDIRFVLPQTVRQQLKKRGEKIKMTAQIKRPYQCVVRYGSSTHWLLRSRTRMFLCGI